MDKIYTLKNWYFEKIKEKYRIWGNIEGHQRFEEGQWIHTSFITQLKVEWGALHVYTENSEYLVKYVEHDALDKRVLRRALRDFLWPDDVNVFQKIQQSENRKKQNIKKEDIPDNYRNCAILTFSSDFLNHFVSLEIRSGKKTYKRIEYDLQRGMFEDIYVLQDAKLGYEFKFFAFGKHAYQFTEWKGKYTPVFINNIGNDIFYASTVYGDYAIQPHTMTMISTNQSRERVNTSDQDVHEEKTSIITHASLKQK